MSDQVDQGLVVGVAGSGGVEEGNVVAGRLFPVAVEVVGPGVEEVEPSEVRWLRADPTPRLSAPAPASYRRVARRDDSPPRTGGHPGHEPSPRPPADAAVPQ